MPEYNIDEFLEINEDNAPTKYKDEIEKKINLLYDFCILHKRKYKRTDEREDSVRELLYSYGSGINMDNAIHEVLTGNRTLNDLLKRKGFL